MKNNTRLLSPLSYLAAFVMGVILFLSIRKDWLPIENLLVLLAGLIGIVLAVLLARVWELHRHSYDDKQ